MLAFLLLWPGHAIIFVPCCFFYFLSSFFLSYFFPRLISAVGDWMCAILAHMVWLSASLRCRSKTCGTRLAANTGRKKSSKSRHLGTTAQHCRAISSQLRHVSTIGKKLLSINISSTCPHNMVNFCPLAAEIDQVVWGTLQISTGFESWQRYCTALEYWASAHFAALKRERHLYSAWRPSRWALAHISSFKNVVI